MKKKFSLLFLLLFVSVTTNIVAQSTLNVVHRRAGKLGHEIDSTLTVNNLNASDVWKLIVTTGNSNWAVKMSASDCDSIKNRFPNTDFSVDLRGVFFTNNYIPASAFTSYSTLKEIFLPDSITEIRSLAFDGCTSLKTIIATGVIYLRSNAFQGCTSLETITFPNAEDVSSSFRGCSSLRSVSLPKATVLNTSFPQCISLESIYLPKVTSITGSAFSNCSSLTSVVLPEVTNISASGNVFTGCTALASVSMPKITTIGNGAFNGCTALKVIELGATPPTVTAASFPAAAPVVLLVPDTTVAGYNYAAVNTSFPAGSYANNVGALTSGIVLAPVNSQITLKGEIAGATGLQWKKAGVNIPGATTNTYISNGYASDSGLYSLKYVLNGTSFEWGPIRLVIGEGASIEGNHYGAGFIMEPFKSEFEISGMPTPSVTVMGNLPVGLDFDHTNQVITGIPMKRGEYKMTLYASNDYDFYAGTYSMFLYTLNTCEAPVILQQPLPDTICEGTYHKFSIKATSSDFIVYQWYNEQGKITQEGKLDSLVTNIPGDYYVELLTCKSIYSDTVNLQVDLNTAIVSQPPVMTSVCEGSSVTFKVEAEGGSLKYQWVLDDIHPISGATSDSYTITNVGGAEDQGNYKVVVTGTCGNPVAITSDAAKLVVAEPLKSVEIIGSDSAYIGIAAKLQAGGPTGYSNVSSYRWNFSNENAFFRYSMIKDSAMYYTTFVDFGPVAQSGTVTVTLVHTCGLYQASKNIKVFYPTGIDDITAGVITVYPNPADDVLQIRSNTAPISQVTVRDASGKSVVVVNGNSSSLLSIPVRDWEKGMYLVQVDTEGGGSCNRKIVKK